MNTLHHRILDISHRLGLSHLGSNLTAVDIIDEIYQVKEKEEPFILSSGHCGLALYVVLEKYYGFDAEWLFKRFGTHPERAEEYGIYCSTGSLGHGLPIAVGMALTDRERKVWCLISDGECTEGTIWEAANVIRKYQVYNLLVYLNWNGYSAYDKIDLQMISNVVNIMPQIRVRETHVEEYGLDGLSAHYVKI
jgi:transketolase